LDSCTIDTYNSYAADFAAEWESKQPEASDLYAIVKRYFRPGRTLDVGCGSGRDTAWLKRQGFDVQGIDASTALLAEARRRHPGIQFQAASLPALEDIPFTHFANVFCETVIMHLPTHEISAAVRRLVSLMSPVGVLYLSWRVTEGADHRDDRGRLYSAFSVDDVRQALRGNEIALDTREISASSGKVVHRIVATASKSRLEENDNGTSRRFC